MQPTMPCLACHQMHREGPVQSKPAARISVAGAAIGRLSGYLRSPRTDALRHRLLSLPQLSDGARSVKVSPDARQALCYQCHAPRQPETGTVAATNHWGRADWIPATTALRWASTKASAALPATSATTRTRLPRAKPAIPQMSHCGIDVEKMDTTFANAKSRTMSTGSSAPIATSTASPS